MLLPVEKDIALVTNSIDQLIHAVEIAQQRRLAAPRGTNKGGHLPLGNIHVDVIERLLLAVEEVEVATPSGSRPGVSGDPTVALVPCAEAAWAAAENP